VEAARLQGDKRLAAFEQQVRAETDATIAAAEADIKQRMQRRTEVRLKTGSKTRAQMSKALAAPEPMVPRPLPTWRPEVAAVLREAPQDAELRRVRAGAEVRRAQAERLARRRSELAARLSRATELAVRRTSGMDGIVVHIPPAEPPVGANLTEQMRPALRTLFGRH